MKIGDTINLTRYTDNNVFILAKTISHVSDSKTSKMVVRFKGSDKEFTVTELYGTVSFNNFNTHYQLIKK